MKFVRTALVACLLTLSILAASPTPVSAGVIDSPGYECTENCPPPPPLPGEDPVDPPTGTSSTDTEPPADGLLATVIEFFGGLFDQQ